MIDNYIMDQSPRITMTLSEILANTPPVQTLAQATDVPGTNLEWMKTADYPTGAWFGDLGELSATGFRDSLFTGYLARGVTCKVSGVPYSWGGAGVGWNPSSCGPIYNGTTLPLPTGGDCLRIRAINPAVPKGWSWLEWTGAIWAPPRGEPIAVKWRSSAAPIANVTPGVTTLTEIYGASAGSPIIPDYMLPDGLVFEASGWIAAYNAAGVSGCVLGIGISGSIMTGTAEFYYPHAAGVTPTATGLGAPYNTRGRGIVSGGLFKGAAGSGNGGGIINNTHGTVVAGANRVWAMAKPSGVADRIQLDGYSFVSEGNL